MVIPDPAATAGARCTGTPGNRHNRAGGARVPPCRADMQHAVPPEVRSGRVESAPAGAPGEEALVSYGYLGMWFGLGRAVWAFGSAALLAASLPLGAGMPLAGARPDPASPLPGVWV